MSEESGLVKSPIELTADGMRVYGPKVDGSYKIEFSIGEYERENLAKLFMMPTDSIITLTIGQSDEQGYKEQT